MNVSPISKQRQNDEPAKSSGRLVSCRPLWHDLAARFPDERECLASYLALEAAEVVDGIKPANLINLIDRQRPCGRNLYQLWRMHGRRLLEDAGLAGRELVHRPDGVLLLIFQPARMTAYLETPKVTNFLRQAGYRQPADREQLLNELATRFRGGVFPHEIGAILGYPLKDVAGFLGWVSLPVTQQGPWKMYGDARPGLAVAAACRSCREDMARRLSMGNSPFDCLAMNKCTPPFFAF